MSDVNIEDKLSVNKYDVDKDVHITLNEDICNRCIEHPCLFVCPAGCYKLMNERINFSFEGCLECGSCRIACCEGAINWTLPRPGFGISYEYG